jgi:hypothetical protein
MRKYSFPDRIAFFNDKMLEFDVGKMAGIEKNLRERKIAGKELRPGL